VAPRAIEVTQQTRAFLVATEAIPDQEQWALQVSTQLLDKGKDIAKTMGTSALAQEVKQMVALRGVEFGLTAGMPFGGEPGLTVMGQRIPPASRIPPLPACSPHLHAWDSSPSDSTPIAADAIVYPPSGRCIGLKVRPSEPRFMAESIPKRDIRLDRQC
jgi:hypothetical protein